MIRNIELTDISDGKLYKNKDFVLAGCGKCDGCSKCCRDTADTIILDPYDMYNLYKGTSKTFTDMIEKEIEIRMVDNLILPNLLIHNEIEASEDGCAFLDEKGMCSIHEYRPGLCRLFPLGRYYDESGMSYFLQTNECMLDEKDRYEVRIKDFLGIKNIEQYEKYIINWHDFCKKQNNRLDGFGKEKREKMARLILQIFYVEPYALNKSFFDQIDNRFKFFEEKYGGI